MDLDSILESSRFGECKVIGFKDLISKKRDMSDFKGAVVKDSVFEIEQEKAYIEFKKELIRRMQPIVENLVDYLRALEGSEKGKGFEEIDNMFRDGDINKPMYSVLVESISDLTKEYKVNLSDNKHFNTSK